MNTATEAVAAPAAATTGAGLLRSLTISLMAFLTVVDLFGTQAILPSLARAYQVAPAAMSIAVNATTFGMAFAGLAVTTFSNRIDHRRGVALSLLLLAVPTALLGTMPPLGLFAALRVAQGVFMATAFSLTLAWLGEACSARAAAGAFAAYITGNVASNLIGRLLSAGLADYLGLPANFLGFALLNIAGAALALATMRAASPHARGAARTSIGAIWRSHLGNPALRVSFAIGFCILFAFLGTFTYVNFALTAPPFSVGPMMLGVVYLVFLPSIFTTPLAGHLVAWLGRAPGLWASLAVAAIGLPLLVQPSLVLVLAGLVLVGVGTFLAQAIATSTVGAAATGERAAASGMYLAAYYLGGLLGTAVLGQVYQHFGWNGCVVGVAVALAASAMLAALLRAAPRLA
ncbi:MAG TPA: MFS transporter [Acetobacteraceae bacterium]|nr:MFS transporter [Acetobacteraceae bacterium]